MHVEVVEIKMQVEGRQSKLLCKYDQISSVVNVQAELETTYEKGALFWVTVGQLRVNSCHSLGYLTF